MRWTPKRKKSQYLTKFPPIEIGKSLPGAWAAGKEKIKNDLQTAESAEAVLPTRNTKRGHVTMSDAIHLAHSGSERQVTRITSYTSCHALFVAKALLLSSTRPVHILHPLTQASGQKYKSWSSSLPNYLHTALCWRTSTLCDLPSMCEITPC